MKELALPESTDKNEILTAVTKYLEELGLKVASTDFARPWGGFFVIADKSTKEFITQFFPSQSYDELANGLALTPKILVVAPQQRLSWQYHYRREEIWSVVAGPVGVVTNTTDDLKEPEILDTGTVVAHGVEVRHRLCGLDGYGVVAEFWRHTDSQNPSDESDIVRVADDYSRN